jgi:hypothetical protein
MMEQEEYAKVTAVLGLFFPSLLTMRTSIFYTESLAIRDRQVEAAT